LISSKTFIHFCTPIE